MQELSLKSGSGRNLGRAWYLISVTEFHEAVAYAIYYIGLEGLHTSLKPKETLIYLCCLCKQQLEPL